jgi:hypothetical protein
VLGSLRLAARAVTRHIQFARSQRRHVRAAYTVYEDTTGSAPAMVGRLRISHALARLSDQQCRAVHLRYLDLSRHRDSRVILKYAASVVMPPALRRWWRDSAVRACCSAQLERYRAGLPPRAGTNDSLQRGRRTGSS